MPAEARENAGGGEGVISNDITSHTGGRSNIDTALNNRTELDFGLAR